MRPREFYTAPTGSGSRRRARHCRRMPGTIAGAVSRYFNTVGFLGWWVNAKILRREEQSAEQIAWFDSVVVPVMSRVEKTIAPPFGQSIFTVLEKSSQ